MCTRRFVVATLSKLIRLSYWGNVQSKVPDAFKAIVPPKPEPQPLVPEPATAAGTDTMPGAGNEQDGDDDMQPAADAVRENGDASTPPAPVDQQGIRSAEFTQMVSLYSIASRRGKTSSLTNPAACHTITGSM